MEKITAQDLIKLKFLGDPVISPDGKHTVYTVQNQDLKKNDYEMRLFLLDNETGKNTQLTDLGQESPAIWLDNDNILFITQRGDADQPVPPAEKTCIYQLNIHGGEAKKYFEVAKNVTELRLLEDGRYLLSVLENLNAPSADITAEELEEEKDYHVLEEIPAYSNGRGYISRLRCTLYVFDRESGSLDKIPSLYFDVHSVDVSGTRIVYTGKEYDTCPSIKGLARMYDLKTGATTELVQPETYSVSGAWMNGETVLLAMTDNHPYGMSQYDDMYRYDIATAKTELLCKVDFSMHAWMATDVISAGSIYKMQNGKLYFIGLHAYHAELFTIDGATGAIECVVPFDGCINAFDVSGDRIALAAYAPDCLVDLYLVENGKPVCKTAVNEQVLAGKYIAHAKYIPFTDSDGVKIDGWVLEPIDFDPSRKYPGVLHVHGGPRGTYGELFNHQMQQLASEGYFVFYCNPRGGEGYGEEFADLRGKYGTIDFQDLMEFTDHVLSLYPQLDPAHLGETGGSYGGFMSNWIEGHTDRFAAIVSCCSISNWVADFVACEFGYTFDANEVDATPWTDMEKMWRQSPLKYANQAKTPILFMQSLCDYNCPMDQGTEMFIAMKYFGVPSKMVVFEGENHGLSYDGKPKHRLRRLKELQAWFDHYLKNA